jgi:hypothetical protein
MINIHKLGNLKILKYHYDKLSIAIQQMYLNGY